MDNLLRKFIQEQPDYKDRMLLVLRPDCTVAYVNETGCHILGYPKEQILGKNWFDHFLPQEEGRRLKDLFTRLLNTNPKRLERFENAVQDGRGQLRLLRWQNSPIKDEKGATIGSFSMGQDITDGQLPEVMQVREEVEKRKLVLSAVLDAQEKERKQIAHELHDNVSQMITTCKLLLETEASKPDASPLLQKATGYLQQVINEIRAISRWLNPSQLVEIGLKEAIRTVILEKTAGGRPRVEFVVNDDAALNALHPDVQLSLFRIVQEQLSNIIQHAQATNAQITLHVDSDQAELEIKDDGTGFNPVLPVTTLGLYNIKSRTENHNGVMYLESAPGDGCTLSICIPLDTL